MPVEKAKFLIHKIQAIPTAWSWKFISLNYPNRKKKNKQKKQGLHTEVNTVANTPHFL